MFRSHRSSARVASRSPSSILGFASASAENANFGWGAVTRHGDDIGGFDTASLESRAQGPARLVVADSRHRAYPDTERGKVGERVGAAARDIALFFVAENDYRRFAGYPFGCTEDESVENQIAVEHHPCVAKTVDQLEKSFAVVHCARNLISSRLSRPSPSPSPCPVLRRGLRNSAPPSVIALPEVAPSDDVWDSRLCLV